MLFLRSGWTRWVHVLLLAFACSGVAPLFAASVQEESAPSPRDWPWASTLSEPLTLGISSTDRSLVGEELRRLAEILGRRGFLKVELASEESYEPSKSRAERRGKSLVAVDRWDKDAESVALDAGVHVMFVVTSASARKGKKVRKKYVPVDKSKGDQKAKNVDVQSLLYKFNMDVWARESASEEGADAWVRVSRIRKDGERDFAPMFLAADTKKVEWDLASVVGEDTYSSLKAARVKLASDWPEEINGTNLASLYATLDEGQKVEFWRRVRLSSPVRIGLPVDAMLDLGLDEWSRTLKEPRLGALQTEVKGYVNGWIASARGGWRFKPPEWLSAIKRPLADRRPAEGEVRTTLESANEVEATANYVEELLENFRKQRPLGVRDRRVPTLVVVAPDDFHFTPFAEAAPDPSRFYRAARVCSQEDFAEIRKSKNRWLKTFKGLKVIQRGVKSKVLVRQTAKSADPAPVIELLFPGTAPSWPGKPD